MIKYRFPSTKSKDKEEQRLAGLMSSYIQKGYGSYDEDFVEKLKKFGYEYKTEKHERLNAEREIFIAKYGYLPPRKTGLMHNFHKIRNKYKNIPTKKEFMLNQQATQLIAFYNDNQKTPSASSKNPIERRLAIFLNGVKMGWINRIDEKYKKSILCFKNKFDLKQKRNLPVGVSKTFWGFTANLYRNKKQFYLGSFRTIEEAQIAIDKAKKGV